MDKFQGYWDLEPVQRLALTDEQIEHHIDVELMREGAVRPLEPEYKLVPEKLNPDKTTMYGVYCHKPSPYGGSDDTVLLCAFESMQKADSFLELAPVVCADKTFAGSDHAKFIVANPKYVVQAVDVTTDAEINRVNESREIAAAIEHENKKLRSHYTEATREVSKIREGIMNDMSDLRSLQYSAQRVVEKFRSFTSLSDGDRGIALNFLLKDEDADECVEKLNAIPDFDGAAELLELLKDLDAPVVEAAP